MAALGVETRAILVHVSKIVSYPRAVSCVFAYIGVARVGLFDMDTVVACCALCHMLWDTAPNFYLRGSVLNVLPVVYRCSIRYKKCVPLQFGFQGA